MTEAINQQETYDIIIIGAGAAGFTSGIYAGRARLKTLVLDGMGGAKRYRPIPMV